MTVESDTEIHVSTPYNSQSAWPLIFREGLRYEDGNVFNDDGSLSDEFIHACSMIVGN